MKPEQEISNIQIQLDDDWKNKLKQETMSWNDLLETIDEKEYDILELKKEMSRLREDIEDNYRPVPISEQVGISDRDFI
jgi:peptidoglycan hydrolase CwlO-like protein